MRQAILIILFAFVVVLSAQNIRLDALSLTPGCVADTDCLPGWFCSSSQCTDRCVLMRCIAGTICKDGACNPVCVNDSQCQQGFVCNGQYCVDKCRFTKCSAGSICVQGICHKKCKADKECLTGFYCSTTGVCEDNCLQTNPCCKSEKCVAGECLPIVIDYTVCPELIQCSDIRPTQKICPNLTWIRKPDPVVCGIDEDGQLVDFPVECYACRNSSIMSYYNTPCAKVPASCVNPVLGELPACNLNEIMIDGQCVLKPTFPINILCNDPRPNEKTCPTVFWFRAPDSVVCGVDANGNYIDFPLECYACKQKDIVFYYNATCDKVKKLSCDTVKCSSNTTCIAGVCVPNTIWPICKKNAKKIKCKKVRPTDETCPVLQWLVAPQIVVCGITATGQHLSYPVECYACKNPDVAYYYNKSCQYLSAPCPKDPITCKTNTDCPKGFFCQSGVCADNCLFMKCSAGTRCFRGVCEPLITSCALIKCQWPKKCCNGLCVDGECVPIAVEKAAV